MKKFYLLALLCLSFFANAQDFSCGAVTETNGEPPMQTYSTPPEYDPNAKYVLNVFIHIVKYDDGSDPSTVPGIVYGELQAMEAIRALNEGFNAYNIFFKYKGHDIINNTDLTNTGNVQAYSGTITPNCYNLYFFSNIGGNSASAFIGNTLIKYTYAALENSQHDNVIIHEMGHCLNLQHIFNNYNNSDCEHVTRDINDPNYNATTAGDRVHDTPAQPLLSTFNFSNCQYIYNPNNVDCAGTPYVNALPANYMGYDSSPSCASHFTPGQVQRMRMHLQNPSMPHVLLTYNTVESLYQPFESRLLPGEDIVSTEENEDGSLHVCRLGHYLHRYQMGFDYHFTDEGQSGFPISQTVNDLPEIEHNLFDVQIDQIDPVATVFNGLTCRCFVCEDEPAEGGTVTSTDFIGSSNFESRDIRKEELVNPTLLYQSLRAGFYHFIKKWTLRGAVYEATIYKPKS